MTAYVTIEGCTRLRCDMGPCPAPYLVVGGLQDTVEITANYHWSKFFDTIEGWAANVIESFNDPEKAHWEPIRYEAPGKWLATGDGRHVCPWHMG